MDHQLFHMAMLTCVVPVPADGNYTVPHRDRRTRMNDRFPNDQRIQSAAVSTPRFLLRMLTDTDEEIDGES